MLDDQHRLTSVEFVLTRNGNAGGDGPEAFMAPSWDVPMHMVDLAGVCKALDWA